MDPKTRDLLLSAWHDKRLAAVHIDLQDFYREYNEETFEAVGNFAAAMRPLSVPNIWVTYPRMLRLEQITPDCTHSEMIPRITTVAEFNEMAMGPNHTPVSLISDIAGARPDETVTIKRRFSAFDPVAPSYLEQHLDDIGADTVLITGVSWRTCVKETLDDGVKLDKYNFIVVDDCINVPSGTTYKKYWLSHPTIDFTPLEHRFAPASAQSVVEALESSRAEAQRAFETAGQFCHHAYMTPVPASISAHAPLLLQHMAVVAAAAQPVPGPELRLRRDLTV